MTFSHPLRRLWVYLASAFFLVLSGEARVLAPGTLISSQAQVTYVEGGGFVSRTIPSNVVRVRVLGGPGLALVQDNVLLRRAGGFIVFPHVVTNTGNDTGSYTLEPSLASGGPFTPLNLRLVIDLDADGVIDSGEPVLPFAAHTFSLPAGESAHFILSGQVPPVLPAGLPDPASLTFHVTASLAETGETLTNTDLLHVTTDDTDIGGLPFTKSVTPTRAARGETVDYTLVGTNTFSSALDTVNLTVDGTLASGFLVRDGLPTNLQLVSILSSSGATPLYHLAGAAEHDYVSSPPADLADVTGVAWLFTGLSPGQSFEVSFRARVGPAASGVIPNTATAYYRRRGSPEQTLSNTTTFTVPAEPPVILYYNTHDDTDPNRRVVPGTRLGSPLFVEAVAGDCNREPDRIEIVTIIITSSLTGDREVLQGLETAANGGRFRILPSVPTEDGRSHTAVHNDGIMQTVSRDTLTAEIVGCGGVSVITEILIDPAGVVFDSRNGALISGAVVTLIDVTGAGNGGNAGGPASVLDDDGFTPVASTQTTGPDGVFRFPLVNPSIYRLQVVPPANYNPPASVIPQGLLPAGFTIHPSGSYGGDFPVNLSTGAVFLDVPLDTNIATGFVLEKKGSRDTAEIGDSVVYTLSLANNSGAPYNGAFIDDRLPLGFRYELGTTRRNGQPVADPEGGVGPNLRFSIGNLADGAKAEISYRVRLTTGADRGDGLNLAQASSLGPPVLVSNVARHRVRPTPGVFDSRGVIIGTVYVDLDGDDVHDAEEPGVPGVRLVLEDGTFAITDSEGQYSIYGQRALTHVLKLDPHTLPRGAVLGGESPRFGLDPGSRFVDLKRYELHKANFAIVRPAPEVLKAVEARRLASDLWKPEILAALETRFDANSLPLAVTDVKGRDASGFVGAGSGTAPSFTPVLPENTLTSANSSVPSRPIAPVPHIPLEKVIETLTDTEPGFLDLRDGDILPFDRLTVRIKAHPESRLALFVNGEPAPDKQIGKNVVRADPPLRAVEYVALRMRPGPNRLELVMSDPWGNERARHAITVLAPDSPSRFRFDFSTRSPAADGRTPVEVRLSVVDKNGLPTSASVPATLQSTLGTWDARDLDPDEPGLQVFVSNGSTVLRLMPPLEPGQARIIATSGTLRDEQTLDFLPELRPMIAAGIIEGRFAFNRMSASNLLPISPDDAFEEELRSSSGIGDDGLGSGRAAFYLKGKIKGDALLTLAYDSDKEREDNRLFRDLDPDAYYPVYGDSSTRGYDAQSTGRLYVRIDKNKSFFLLGDYNTRSEHEVRQLADYNRSLNGFRYRYETARFQGDLWASDDSTQQIIREIPANGTSGPFNFAAGEGVLGSETVEILVRDRNQTSVILTTRKLVRNTDYDFEPFTGRVLLRRPVPSVDSNFNPQSIRITYEVETGGDRFWTYGGHAQFKPVERVEVGTSFARDENPVAPYELDGVNATVRIADGTYLMAEGAQSRSLFSGTTTEQTGNAGRVEIRHKSEDLEARVFYGDTEATFENPASQLSAGRSEGGAKATYVITPELQFITEAVYTRDNVGAGERQGARGDFAYTFPNEVKVTVGGRASEETIAPADPADGDATPVSVRSARVRLDSPVPFYKAAAVFGEFEQDIRIADQRLIAGGGNIQVSPKTRLYARHEFVSSLGSPFELNSSQQNNRTVFGLETEYIRDAHFFNEYRVRNAIDGGQSEASTGLRNGWSVAEGLRLETTFERVTPLDAGTVSGNRFESESTAATVAAEYTRPENWKATGRLEGRWDNEVDTYLSTLGYARRLNPSWTLLNRGIVSTQVQDDETADRVNLYQARLLTGLAWRQRKGDEWNALFRHEYKYEEGAAYLGDIGLRRHVNTLAASVNYQPAREWILAGHYATKFVQESSPAFGDADYIAHLLAGRLLYEFHRRWDAGLSVAAMFSQNFDNVQWAVGPEIGHIFTKNVRIGLGYNVVGFSDRDFDAVLTEAGLFLSLRVKFDENLLKWARFGRDEKDEESAP